MDRKRASGLTLIVRIGAVCAHAGGTGRFLPENGPGLKAAPLSGGAAFLLTVCLSGRVDVQGVEAGREFRFQRVIDRPMLRQPGEAGEGSRADFYRVMCLATRGCASMTVVQMRLVHYIKLIRGKSSG